MEKEHLEKHYADLKEKKFFPSLIKYSTLTRPQSIGVIADIHQCFQAPLSVWSGRVLMPV